MQKTHFLAKTRWVVTPIGALGAGLLLLCLPLPQAWALPSPFSLPVAPLDQAEQRRVQAQREQAQRQHEQSLNPQGRGGVVDQGLDALQFEAQKQEAAQQLPQETPCFVINAITLRTQEVVPAVWQTEPAPNFDFALRHINRTAQGLWDPIRGHCLGVQGVNIALARVQNAIIAAGYTTTRVLVPEQDLKSGALILAVIPGRVAAIGPDASMNEQQRQRLTLANAIPLRPGQVLQLRAIEQGLENLKRAPTADAEIAIAAHTAQDMANPNNTAVVSAISPHAPNASANPENAIPGLSDIVVRYQQGLPLRLALSLDNSGTPATGILQGQSTLSVDNPLSLNDALSITGAHSVGGFVSQRWTQTLPHSRNSRALSLSYSIPWGYWLLSWNANFSDYQQTVAGAFTNYRYSGRSHAQDVRVSRVLQRNAQGKTLGYVKLWERQSWNYVDNVEIEVQRRRTAGWELGLNHREQFGAANLELNVSHRHSSGARRSLPAVEEAFGEGVSRPKLWFADVQWQTPLPWPKPSTEPNSLLHSPITWRSSWHGQWTKDLLIPAERFSLGGRSTVRGYDGNMVIQAERGWVSRNELSWTLGRSAQELYLAWDYGRIHGPSAQWMLSQSLQSIGLGWRGRGSGWAKGLSYDVWVATALRKPPHFSNKGKVIGLALNWNF